MGALDTAREIVKIAVSSGLGQELIALLEKKSALLSEQVSTLESEKAVLIKRYLTL